MTQTTDESKRARFAIAIASCMTTLAVGVTIAALSGYVRPPSAKPPAGERVPSAPAAREAAPRMPVRESEPAVVLVPVERIETAPPAAVEADALAYADDDAEGRDDDDDDDDDGDDSDEHEGHHDD